MEKTDVLVIGGSAAGVVAATTGKTNYPEKEFMVIRKQSPVLVPCGIPYIFGSLKSMDKNIMPDSMLTNADIKLQIGEVASVDKENKICKTTAGLEIKWEKLVLATGSNPITPQWLKGANQENVFTISKEKDYLDNLQRCLPNFQKVVVIGGGFIGVEIADEINKLDKEVTVVEILPHVLGLAFDEEIAVKAQELLISRGVKIKTGAGVKEIMGDGKASGVLLNNGEKVEADAVILSMGYSPNTKLAQGAGLSVNRLGAIRVDEYMRTPDDPNIFAVGDCAEKRHFITRKVNNVMLASTGGAEARTAGMNLYHISSVKAFLGTIAIFSTAFGDRGFGAAGITEREALREGVDIITGAFEGIDRHPGTQPGTNKQFVKVIAARECGLILGGEVAGGPGTGELINLIGLAIQNKMNICSILTSQIGTHPLLTAPPTAYPFIKAAEVASRKFCHQ